MTLEARIELLLAYFGRSILDVPDGLFDKNAVLVLNGVPYEMRLGRSADDPLVRLIARGPAGYRFIAKALLHALEHASASVGSLTSGEAIHSVNVTLREQALEQLRDARAR